MKQPSDPFQPLHAAYAKALKKQEARRKAYVANVRAFARENPEYARVAMRLLSYTS